MRTTAEQVYLQYVKNIPLSEQLELIALISHQLSANTMRGTQHSLKAVASQAKTEPAATPVKKSAMAILEESPGHRIFKTAEEVETYLHEERKTWED